jgi:cyclic pyranopterin phosphate synthase
MPAPKFSHLDAKGTARMVAIGKKPVQNRLAVAEGMLQCQPETIRLLKQSALPKGDVLGVARIAAIQAVKQTAMLIPLCHPLFITHVGIEFAISKNTIKIRCSVVTDGKTGVEMEALTGASIAALTLYDMCKAVDKKMKIGNLHVVKKIKQ